MARTIRTPYLQDPFELLDAEGRRRTRSDAGLCRVLDRIARNPVEMPRVEESADIAGRSQESFRRHFKNVTGRTYKTFIKVFRLELALLLLRMSDMPIATIAQWAGYTHVASLCGLVQREVGRSPSAYRKALRGKTREAP